LQLSDVFLLCKEKIAGSWYFCASFQMSRHFQSTYILVVVLVDYIVLHNNTCEATVSLCPTRVHTANTVHNITNAH
jgi:hypothetical protein